MANLADGILAERDRLMMLKNIMGETWNEPNFIFYRTIWQDLIDRSTEAIGGGMDVVQMIQLLAEMKEFEQ